MISLTRLLCNEIEEQDHLRYGREGDSEPRSLSEIKPIVVWNSVRACNLRCVHCYAHATGEEAANILSTEEARRMIDDVAAFGCPVLLFSGGEPLLRKDLAELAGYAREKGLRTVISTNGTLITEERAGELKRLGISYAGVSLDGLEKRHDEFRRMSGAFRRALQGIKNCQAAGVRTGLRFTITRDNAPDAAGLFDLAVAEGIPRQCYYHLVYTGRGSAMIEHDLSPSESRSLMEQLIEKTMAAFQAGYQGEVLTVDNHSDGPFIYLWALQHRPELAPAIMQLLLINRAASTGIGISCIDWEGNVYPDQFWRDKKLGNIREKPFSQIWSDTHNEFLKSIRERELHVTGRCAECRFLAICRGNFRARAEAATGDLWAPDPACYLTNQEIAK